MAYAIQGFITRDPEVAARMAVHGPTVSLPQGHALLPLTTELLSHLGIPLMAFDEAERPGQFMRINGLGIEFSEASKVAYIEAADIGGVQYQGAIAWANGTEVVSRTVEPGAIDLALNALGATDDKPGHDLFAALKLGSHKATDNWLKEG